MPFIDCLSEFLGLDKLVRCRGSFFVTAWRARCDAEAFQLMDRNEGR
jgi:hypothetical protein